MKVIVDHVLPKQEAKTRISKLIEELKTEHRDKISDEYENWNGDSADFGFKVSGMKITGKLIIRDSDVEINGKLPFLAIPFKSQIENLIREKAEELLKP